MPRRVSSTAFILSTHRAAMKKLILAVVLLLCAAAPAAAQEEPTPGELQAVRELLEVTRVRDNLLRTIEASMDANPMAEGFPAGFREQMTAFFEEHFRYEDLEPGFIRMYTDLFTEEELRAFTAFYRTPAGQRFVELTPELAGRSQQITMEVMAEALPALMEMMMESMELEEEDEEPRESSES
jgi:hypothetical protein